MWQTSILMTFNVFTMTSTVIMVSARAAHAKQLASNRTFPQSWAGTETAHGTNHIVSKQRIMIAFNGDDNPLEYIRRNVKPKKPAYWVKDYKYNHNTNMQTTVAAAKAGKKVFTRYQ